MNTMNMPGFTADASFYRSSARYQAGAMLPSRRQGEEVLPQRIRCIILEIVASLLPSGLLAAVFRMTEDVFACDLMR
jgi:hypothetical protein